MPNGYIDGPSGFRGAGESEVAGQYRHAVNEADGPDGYDIVGWIVGLPWAVGRIGKAGGSLAPASAPSLARNSGQLCHRDMASIMPPCL